MVRSWWPWTLAGRWQRRRQRNIDREFLFPVIRAQEPDPCTGSRAIAAHIATDPAWRYVEEWIDEPRELPQEPA